MTRDSRTDPARISELREPTRVDTTALLDQVTDAVFAFDADWRYTYVNAAACEFTGYPRHELLGRSCWGLYPDFRQSENARIIQRAMREREAASWTSHSIIADSWTQWRVCPTADGGLTLFVNSIEERVRAERAHTESEQRFRALADRVPCLIWTADATGQLTWVNQRWIVYAGLGLDDLQSSPLSLVHPADGEAAFGRFYASATARRPASIELRLRRHDGTYRWHLAQLQPVLDIQGEVAYWFGSATDIQAERDALSAERDARRDAEEMRDHLRRVVAQAPIALAVFRGPDHVVEVATARARDCYGCERIGNAAREALSEAARQRGVLERLKQVYATGRSLEVQGEHVSDEGKDFVFDTSYSALRRGSGEVYGVLVSSVDVTAQTLARKHAERERERLARVLEQAPFAVAITSGPQHVLKSANERQRRLFGARATLNMSLREAFPEADLEPVHALFDRAFHQRVPIVLREQRIGWDREGRGDIVYGHFDLIYQPITDEHDRVEGLLCVSTDVSESVDARLAVARARDEAYRARDRLDQILSTIPASIVVTRGPEHVYDLVNPGYVSLVNGLDVIGHRIGDLFPQVRENGFLDIFDRVYTRGETVQTPQRRVVYDRNLDGNPVECFFSSFFAPLRDRDGQITGVVGAGVEVTEEVRQRTRNDALRAESEAARHALEQAHAQLERRISERTRELFSSNEALAAEIKVRTEAETARNDLQRRFNTAREDEQRRTARDLHDQVGQTLSALMLAIKTACEAEPLPQATMVRLEDALRLAEDLGRDIHEIATRLRPAVLDAFGLYAALRQLLRDWSQRSGTPVDFEAVWLKNKRYPAEIETTLYRVTQEALTNVARHAQASHVSVVVERNAGCLICIVEDDGIGFAVGATDAGRMGLASMRERVTLVGGSLDLESTPGTGTTIIVSVPISGGAA